MQKSSEYHDKRNVNICIKSYMQLLYDLKRVFINIYYYFVYKDIFLLNSLIILFYYRVFLKISGFVLNRLFLIVNKL